MTKGPQTLPVNIPEMFGETSSLPLSLPTPLTLYPCEVCEVTEVCEECEVSGVCEVCEVSGVCACEVYMYSLALCLVAA